MSKTKQALWTKFGGKEFFARMAENAKNDGEGNEIYQTYATKDVATTTADGLLSKDDKSKLNKIAAGAQVNAIESISANGTALSPDDHKNVDIPLATSEVDGLLPKEKFPLIPAEPVAGADRIYSFDDTNGTSWQTIVKEYVGNMILDQQGTPVTDEKGDIMYEEEAVPLWLSYKGTEFGARRAYEDHTGQNINEALATKTTMSQVNNAIEAALANYGGFVVVGSLTDGHPDVANPSERFIYLYKDPQLSVTDPYTEWIYTSSHEWDVIGETTIDVTGKQDSLSALPSMAASKFLQTDANQNIVWGNLPQMSGATSSAAGTAGTVPAPTAGDQAKFLKGDGTWDTVADSPLFMATYTATTGNAMKAAIQSGKAVMCNARGYAPSQFGLLGKCDLNNNKYQFLYIYKNTNAYAQQLGDIAFRMVFCNNSGSSSWFGQFAQLTFKAPTAAGQVMKSASNGSGEFDWTLSTVSEVPTSAVGDAGKVLSVNSSGTAEWILPSNMTGATASTDGASGLVPAPLAEEKDKFLKGDGTWAAPPEANLANYYYDDSGNGLSAKRTGYGNSYNTSLLGSSGNMNAHDLSARFYINWGGSVKNFFSVETTDSGASRIGFGSDSINASAMRYLLPTPVANKYAKTDANGKITWGDVPSLPSPTINDSLLLGQADGSETWTALENDVFGTRLPGEETGEPMYDASSTDQLWTGFAGKEFGAARAYADQDGNNIKATYATKEDLNAALGDIESLLAAL